MNNEPVAWMQTWQNQDGELKQTVNIEQIGNNDIPLYTHSAKTLKHENHDWDRGVWTVGVDGMMQEFIESSDFHHDVRLYLNGDFETDTQRLNYLQHIADRLNAYPAKTLTDEEIDDIENAIYCKTIQKGKTQHEYIKAFARAILKKASEK